MNKVASCGSSDDLSSTDKLSSNSYKRSCAKAAKAYEIYTILESITTSRDSERVEVEHQKPGWNNQRGHSSKNVKNEPTFITSSKKIQVRSQCNDSDSESIDGSLSGIYKEKQQIDVFIAGETML